MRQCIAYSWWNAKISRVTGLEILDKLVQGRTVFHRDHDAWDLIDDEGLVAAVLCPRREYVTVSLPAKRVKPKRLGAAKIPYGERKADEIRADDLQRGVALISRLVATQVEAR